MDPCRSLPDIFQQPRHFHTYRNLELLDCTQLMSRLMYRERFNNISRNYSDIEAS